MTGCVQKMFFFCHATVNLVFPDDGGVGDNLSPPYRLEVKVSTLLQSTINRELSSKPFYIDVNLTSV